MEGSLGVEENMDGRIVQGYTPGKESVIVFLHLCICLALIGTPRNSSDSKLHLQVACCCALTPVSKSYESRGCESVFGIKLLHNFWIFSHHENRRAVLSCVHDGPESSRAGQGLHTLPAFIHCQALFGYWYFSRLIIALPQRNNPSIDTASDPHIGPFAGVPPPIIPRTV